MCSRIALLETVMLFFLLYRSRYVPSMLCTLYHMSILIYVNVQQNTIAAATLNDNEPTHNEQYTSKTKSKNE